MTIEQRHTQIQEGAGLTESKLNVEFVDFLKKYSTPILLIITLAALCYVGWDRYQRHRDEKMDTAWESLESALQARNPEGLIAVAEEHSGFLGIPLIARTEAADILLQFGMLGLAPGAQLKPTGEVQDTMDLLSPEQKIKQLERAASEYQIVIESASKDEALVLHKVKALFGLAAVNETLSKFDDAKKNYEQVIEAAKFAALPSLAEAAQKLLDTMDEARNAPRLFASDQIVTRPPPPLQLGPSASPGSGPFAPIPPLQMPPDLLSNTKPETPAPAPGETRPAENPPAEPEKPAEAPKGN